MRFIKINRTANGQIFQLELYWEITFLSGGFPVQRVVLTNSDLVRAVYGEGDFISQNGKRVAFNWLS